MGLAAYQDAFGRAEGDERFQHRTHVIAVAPDPRGELAVAPGPRAAFAVTQVAIGVQLSPREQGADIAPSRLHGLPAFQNRHGNALLHQRKRGEQTARPEAHDHNAVVVWRRCVLRLCDARHEKRVVNALHFFITNTTISAFVDVDITGNVLALNWKIAVLVVGKLVVVVVQKRVVVVRLVQSGARCGTRKLPAVLLAVPVPVLGRAFPAFRYQTDCWGFYLPGRHDRGVDTDVVHVDDVLEHGRDFSRVAAFSDQADSIVIPVAK
mmetsp:Transcript_4659/g.17259  ORF Transcript_4659/g.17259 Transcript_4659/m.17259 type:complete len:266 (-) Transcript_4659:1976-2773(-)